MPTAGSDCGRSIWAADPGRNSGYFQVGNDADAYPPPAGGGPFALSAPGKLAGLFAEAGLNVIANGEVDCPFSYPDFETLWRGIVSSGPLQALVQVVDPETVKSTLKSAADPFRLANSGYLIQPNILQYGVATR